jgi:hypothetical protein
MNWEAFGAIGEVLGALGVIATLGYLAVQVRQNTTSTRTSSYQAAVGAISDWSKAIGLDPDASRILGSGTADYASLPDEDRLRFDLIYHSLFRNFENVFYQHMQGAIDEALWVAWSWRIRDSLAHPGVRRWWKDARHAYHEPFVRFVEEASFHGSDADDAGNSPAAA